MSKYYSIADVRATPAIELNLGDIVVTGDRQEVITGWSGRDGKVRLHHGGKWNTYEATTVLEAIKK